MKSFEKKKSENEHFHERSVVRTRPPPIFGFILTSRIPQNTSQLRGKEDPERERERERRRERKEEGEKRARLLLPRRRSRRRRRRRFFFCFLSSAFASRSS